jgi:Tol biopolymer transport system component
MNKKIFDQLSADEKHIASKLNATAENMKILQDFQWTLESQLMDTYQNKSQPTANWFSKFLIPAGWAIAAVIGFVLLNWTIRSFVPSEQINPVAPNTEITVETFETKVRQGNICEGPLALAHGFAVFLTNEDKTAFLRLDEEKAIGELRSMVWSSNGDQLAILGNTLGSGNIYITNSSGTSLQPVLNHPELGYLYYFDWSRDGRQFVVWSLDHKESLYVFNMDGSGLVEKQLNVQINGTPKFYPDNSSIIFLGSNTSTYGLFELTVDDLQIRQISKLVEDESGFAFSQDGSRLAYFEMDRDLGKARLVAQEFSSGDKTTLATLPIPKGSGSSIPDAANLNWSQDGTKLVFQFGINAADRAIYLAYADGAGLIKIVKSAHAPTISGDGNCLAYISNKQVVILDLNEILLASNPVTPMLLVDLPKGKGASDFRLDKLQWRP